MLGFCFGVGYHRVDRTAKIALIYVYAIATTDYECYHSDGYFSDSYRHRLYSSEVSP